jgi:putative transposase
MARIARVIVPGCPHYVMQRSKRRRRAFLADDDYRAYLDLLAERCRAHRVALWAYCLMPDRIHLIAVPKTSDGLARTLAETHRLYTRRLNFCKGRRGHLWRGRFSSFPMDMEHCVAAARHIERNPVREGLVKQPWQWPWSSAAAHVTGRGGGLVKVRPLLAKVGAWRRFLQAADEDAETAEQLRRHEVIGRPLGADAFVIGLEKLLRRRFRPRKRGPKPKRKRK